MPDRDEKGRWIKGHSGNPAGGPGKRAKVPADILSLMQKNTKTAVQRIIALLDSEDEPTRLAAAKYLVEKGLGRDFTAFEPMEADEPEKMEIHIIRASREN